MRNRLLLVLIAVLLPFTFSCTPAGDTIIVTPTQTLITAPIGPGVLAGTPTPAPGGVAKFTSVRVGIFTQTCPSGGSIPDNAQNSIRLGCVATLTATPKDANNQDLSLPDAAWALMRVSWTVTGTSCADVDAAGGGNANPFNRQLRGEVAGTCVACATVDGIQGCAVQPDGQRLVKVIP